MTQYPQQSLQYKGSLVDVVTAALGAIRLDDYARFGAE